MPAQTLGFFTQNEIDRVVGYTRQRQRLVDRGVLPRGEHLRTFGHHAVIYPEFAAAGLIAQRPSEHDRYLLGLVSDSARRLFESAAFGVIAAVVRDAMQAQRSSMLVDLVDPLLERAGEALRVWRDEIAVAQRGLAEAGIRLQTVVGRIEEVSPAGYRIAVADPEAMLFVAPNATRKLLPEGTWVTYDVVELGARKGEVLVPTVAPDRLAAMGDATADDDIFAAVDFLPVVVPAVRDERDDDDEGDVVRPRRRLTVRANRALYANANTMTRDRPATTAR